MRINPELKNNFIVENDKLVAFDELGEYLTRGIGFPDEASEETISRFNEIFETMDSPSHILGDPDEEFYQGVTFIQLIRRKSDGQLFGFEYFEMFADGSEWEPNGDEHGYEIEPPDNHDWDNDYFPSVYVFLPVRPFTVTGYTTKPE